MESPHEKGDVTANTGETRGRATYKDSVMGTRGRTQSMDEDLMEDRDI